MPQQRLYFEEINKLLVPYMYVLTFKPTEIKWDKPVHFFDAITPFNYVGTEKFNENLNSAAIYFSDFIFNEVIPDRFGLNLVSIKKRIHDHGVDPYVINQFILPTNEISKVMSVIPKENNKSILLI
ncbi:hypothetical protein [Cytobacillus gottheilii]|uniref:Uncharacterized protein n=1 Tax=Cytobacillus gottheilii TaxID=859144 RepID=A0ABX8F9G7_9BACI|nr:hypothetical protein [Cytobacillus gottheilii]QVY60976.1 hypothetical protein J1899_18695 [Cytobacillus gottheilii]